jgi:hypothetical protein
MAEDLEGSGNLHPGDAFGLAAPEHAAPPISEPALDSMAPHLLPPHVDQQLLPAEEADESHPDSGPAHLLPLPLHSLPASLDSLPSAIFPPPFPPPSSAYILPVQLAVAQEASAVPDPLVVPDVLPPGALPPYVSYLDQGCGQAPPYHPPGTEPVDDAVYEPFLLTHFGLPEHPPRGSVRVYYSIDPTRGTIDVYPKRFCKMINAAIHESSGKCKGEIYLGPQFFDATVHWNHTEGARWSGEGPKLYQTTPGGSIAGSWKNSGMRDVWVKDFEMGGSRQLCHEVQRVNYEWTGFIDARLPDDDPTQRTATTEVPEEHFVFDDGEEPVPRWQWCKRTNETMDLIPWEERPTGRSTIFNVLEKDWGFYTDEVDQEIQAAHAAEEPHVDVVLCSRQYRIMFQKKSIYAKQIDPIMRKERVARLVFMKPTVIQERMAGEACNLSDDQVCPICLLQFKDTPTIQVFALPCGHQFHGMCIQNVADQNQKCPYCRYFALLFISLLTTFY